VEIGGPRRPPPSTELEQRVASVGQLGALGERYEQRDRATVVAAERIRRDDPLTLSRLPRRELIDDRGNHLAGVASAHGDDVAPTRGQVGEHRHVVVDLVGRGRGLRDQGGADRAARQIQEHAAATEFDHPG
jgi:hypothetical protein